MDILVSILDKGDHSSRQVRCPLRDRVVAGRGAECSILIEGSAISREHLVLERDETDGLVVTDVSANGCWVNGNQIAKMRRVPLRETDLVEVPGFELRIQYAAANPAPPRTEMESAPPAPLRPASSGAASRGRVSTLLASFSGGEKMAALLALASLGFVLVYALS